MAAKLQARLLLGQAEGCWGTPVPTNQGLGRLQDLGGGCVCVERVGTSWVAGGARPRPWYLLGLAVPLKEVDAAGLEPQPLAPEDALKVSGQTRSWRKSCGKARAALPWSRGICGQP